MHTKRSEHVSHTVRPADATDFGQIGDLLVGVYVGEGYSPPEAEASLSDVSGRSEGAEVLVACEDDRVLGVAFLVLHGPHRQVGREAEAELRTLAVDPGARRGGIGNSLLRASIDLARAAGCVRIVLSTQPTMYAAQLMYEKLGFMRMADRDWERARGQPMLAFGLELHLADKGAPQDATGA
jgi:ribosomal protein S18 acetylase RimI-like enzyme